MSQEKLLPIGSVVLLKESNKRVMIVGRLQRQMGTEKVWDYSACFYPEGILDPQKMFLFNHDQIAVLSLVFRIRKAWSSRSFWSSSAKS